jgi:hypothetical protein
MLRSDKKEIVITIVVFETKKLKYLELYSDYLIFNAGSYATATELSQMIGGNVSHNQCLFFNWTLESFMVNSTP